MPNDRNQNENNPGVSDTNNTNDTLGFESIASDLQDMSPEEEKKALLQRAKRIGLSVSNNSSVETLRKKIAEALEPDKKSASPSELAPAFQFIELLQQAVQMQNGSLASQQGSSSKTKGNDKKKAETLSQKKNRLRLKAEKLVRIRFTCMNPAKRDLPGEFLTAGNRYVGTISKFLPYNVQEPYHVPFIIYEMMREKKFAQIRTVRGRNGSDLPEVRWVPEYNIEVLPPLNEEQIRKLALKQAAQAGELTS